MIKILAISGSTRQQSSNHQLIAAIAERYAGEAEVTLYNGLTQLPHFNPDLDQEQPPEAVAAFRAQLRAADAVLICTPEYAIGVPGSLKNAIDWTVSSMEFSKKAVALITAGTSGVHAHQSLLGTLLIIESRIREEMQLVIPAIKTKMSPEGVITHGETLTAIDRLMHALLAVAVAPREDDVYLHPPAFNKV
ncbi:NADPH-dependent FMN reductase [Chitinophaga sp. sic0106]|uniref:NADPH-dependent FMN reductase n=1 Tax=Chitinophaga sp. sic0106 TaxID=2854785 RepID=UPI001C493017|nr:NADPH-dependent FMN reductase [Chitinophaga sp. sic0106]MBV7531585.1 NAD(P)H-dependent oxidoreductase [Chitinophaga sp. sic0106]